MPTFDDYKACADAGMTAREAGEKLGLSRHQTAKAGRRYGLTFRPARTLITHEILTRIVSMQAAGISQVAIGAKLGFAPISISVALSRARNGEFGKGWRGKESAAGNPATPSDRRGSPRIGPAVAPNHQSPAVPVGPSGGASAGRAAAFPSPARPKRRVVTPEQVAAAIVLKASGQSWEAIGRVLGYRGDVVKVAVARHRTALADAAPEPEPEEEEEEDVPAEPRFLPDANVVASLMMRGFSRWDAIAQSIADKKAKARRETSPAKQSPAPRIGAGPYRMTVGA